MLRSVALPCLAARPRLEVIAHGNKVTIRDNESGTEQVSQEVDPLSIPRKLASNVELATPTDTLPDSFCGGWVGHIGYDAVRWLEAGENFPSMTPPRMIVGFPTCMSVSMRNWSSSITSQNGFMCLFEVTLAVGLILEALFAMPLCVWRLFQDCSPNLWSNSNPASSRVILRVMSRRPAVRILRVTGSRPPLST